MTRYILLFIVLPLAMGCGSRPSEVAEEPERILNERIYWMEDSVSWVEIKDGKFGIYWEGTETIAPVYDIEELDASIMRDGYCYFYDGAHFALGKDGKWGVMDNHGTIVIPFEYDHVVIHRDDNGKMRYGAVKKGGKYAIVSPAGELLTGFDYEEFYGDFHYRVHDNPILAVYKGDRVVFYDYANKKEIDTAPEGEFQDGVIMLRYRNKWGVITKDGSFIVPPEYDQVDIIGGQGPWYVTVCKEGKCGILLTGKGLVLPMDFQTATTEQVDGKLFYIVSKDDRYALLNGSGDELTDFDYEYLYLGDSTGFVGGRKDKNYSVDTEGNETLIE